MYLGMTRKEELSLLVTFHVLALVFLKSAYDMFAGPLSVASAIDDLVQTANRLRIATPVEWSVEVAQLLDYIRDQNGLAGPGYVMAGQLFTKRLLWNIAGSFFALLMGALASSL